MVVEKLLRRAEDPDVLGSLLGTPEVLEDVEKVILRNGSRQTHAKGQTLHWAQGLEEASLLIGQALSNTKETGNNIIVQLNSLMKTQVFRALEVQQFGVLTEEERERNRLVREPSIGIIVMNDYIPMRRLDETWWHFSETLRSLKKTLSKMLREALGDPRELIRRFFSWPRGFGRSPSDRSNW